LQRYGAVNFVQDADGIAAAVDDLLTNTEAAEESGRAARAFVRGKASQLNTIAQRLVASLGLEERHP